MNFPQAKEILKDRKLLVSVILSFILILVSFIILIRIGQIRLNEITLELNRIENRFNPTYSAGLLKKYMLLRYRPGALNQLYQELEVMAALSTPETKEKEQKTWSVALAEKFVTFFDSLSGVNETEYQKSQRNIRMLEDAYFMESISAFPEAISLYEKVRKVFHPDSYEHRFAAFHEAFCFAVTGDTKKALNLLKKVFIGRQDDLALSARKFYAFIQETQKLQKSIARLKPSAEKAEKYMKIGDHLNALKTIEKMRPEKRTQKVALLKATALESLGLHKAAILRYRKLAQSNSEYAKEANRRLFILGQKINDKKIIRESIRNGYRLRDNNFIEKSQSIATIIPQRDKEKLKAEKISKYSIKETDSSIPDITYQKYKEEAGITTIAKVEPPKSEKKKASNKPAKKPDENSINEKAFKALQPDADGVSASVMRRVLNTMLTIPEREKVLRDNYPNQTEIITMDNNRLVGPIIEASGKEIRIVTVYGIMRLKRSQIKKATKKQYR